MAEIFNRYRRFMKRVVRIMNDPELFVLYYPNEVSGWKVVNTCEVHKGDKLLMRANGNTFMISENNYLRIRKDLKYVNITKSGKAV